MRDSLKGRSAKDLARSLDYLRDREVVQARETVVLFAPPLTAARYKRETQRYNFWRWIRGQRYEFVRRNAFLSDWPKYRQAVVYPLVKMLSYWQTMEHRTLLDATWSDFRRWAGNEDTKLLILVAHHAVWSPQQHGIELADGFHSFQKVNEWISQSNRKSSVAIAWFICEASEWVATPQEDQPQLKAVACAAWKMPLTESVQFITHWIKSMQEPGSLLDTWHQALQKMIEEPVKNPNNDP